MCVFLDIGLVWSLCVSPSRGYLRIVFTCMERYDLSRETHAQDIAYFAKVLGVDGGDVH